ncbi:MAG: ribonuclease III [Lachnospiraceae bacterium]|nr:ribonuclease III [Lachnospiraceae bacterium]
MEKALRADDITGYFGTGEQDLRSYSPLGLAFVGDAVYSLIVRTITIEQGNTKVEKLHLRVSDYARASYQSALAAAIYELLDEEETDVYKRGRNARSHAAPKNASTGDYHRATGLEALIGYLYLAGREERIMELMKKGMQLLKEKEDGIQ